MMNTLFTNLVRSIWLVIAVASLLLLCCRVLLLLFFFSLRFLNFGFVHNKVNINSGKEVEDPALLT